MLPLLISVMEIYRSSTRSGRCRSSWLLIRGPCCATSEGISFHVIDRTF
uniref:Uncharacterized protein n=1 Tax=Arundo donax TaxID=35708 RepID=A0A0A9EQM4_ARUDO